MGPPRYLAEDLVAARVGPDAPAGAPLQAVGGADEIDPESWPSRRSPTSSSDPEKLTMETTRVRAHAKGLAVARAAPSLRRTPLARNRCALRTFSTGPPHADTSRTASSASGRPRRHGAGAVPRYGFLESIRFIS